MKMKTKPWFKIKDVEYSTNFKFFLENQIGVSRRGVTHKFFSLLDGKVFLIQNSLKYDGEMNQEDISAFIHQIHSKLLGGKFGEGKFVN